MTRHPDVALMQQARSAIAWWEAQAPSEPTSSRAGSGAVAFVERSFGDLVDGRPVLALPSGTAALLVGLMVVGVRPGDDVLVPALDWTAASQTVRLLGARPVPVAVDLATMTIDPCAARDARTPRTAAVVVTHLLGVVADVAQVRRKLLGLPVVEDCAQALGARLDDVPAGTQGDVAAFSGKGIGVDGCGFLATSSRQAHRTAVALSQHPLRQRLDGVEAPSPHIVCTRVPDVVAVVAAYAVHRWQEAQEARRNWSREVVEAVQAGRVPGRMLVNGRRTPAPGQVPVLLDEAAGDLSFATAVGAAWCDAGAVVLPRAPDQALLDAARRAGILVPRTVDLRGSESQRTASTSRPSGLAAEPVHH